MSDSSESAYRTVREVVMMTTGLAGDEVRGDPEELVGAAAELGQALVTCDFPLVVWQLPAAVVQVGNQPAAELFGLPLDQLIGTPATDLVGPADAVRRALAMVAAGQLDDAHATRWVRLPDGSQRPVRVWTRSIEVDGARAAVSLVIPVAEVGRLGRDIAAPWRDLSRVAVGVADRHLRVLSVSKDVRDVLYVEPDDVVGKSLLDLVELRSPLGTMADGLATTVVHRQARVRRADGRWADACLLLGGPPRAGGSDVSFALSTALASAAPPAGRIAELEQRLRIIGLEVRSAGLLEGVADLPSVSEHPQLRELTSRQWEILSRLLRGERTPTIAAELYISPSTVRNHLAAIFQKFGVHSQAELLAALRQPRP
jgi:DNA-binding CsgD family transcriptional regulator/PAS domain-containing protein